MSLRWDDPRLSSGKDQIVSALAVEGQVRLVACRSRTLVREAARIHGLSQSATLALGRLLTGGLLLASDLKNDGDSLTLRVDSASELRAMTVVAEGDGSCRGEISAPQLEPRLNEQGRLELASQVLPGRLTVIRDHGLREPWVGTVDLVSGEIGDDLAYYLYHSEQKPGIVALSVDFDQNGVHDAAGLLVEALPGATEATIARLEARLDGFPDISYWLREGFEPAQLMDLFIGDPEIQLMDWKPAVYRCRCSRERMRAYLAALGLDDRREIAADPDGAELVCHFCGTRYHFEPAELAALLPADDEARE